MPKSVKLVKSGDNQQLQIENIDSQNPGEGQILVKNIVAGINEDDIFVNVPEDKRFIVPGYSASGDVLQVGANVTGFRPGDSVVYFTKNMGSYQENAIVNAENFVAVPEEIYQKTAGATYFAGMMAHSLLKRVYIIGSKSIVLIHNISSGIGYILAQWANDLGAIVIGSVDSDNKKAFALEHGCRTVVNYQSENWQQEIMEFTKGYGVNIIYDSLGGIVHDKNIACMTKMGILVYYGARLNQMANIDINKLSAKSLYITFPSIFDYKSNKMERVLCADEVFGMIKAGRIKVKICDEYSLDNISQAYDKVKSNNFMGSALINI
ncbi:MAG: zinc-binding dehydrogenase [Rickettsiales bacterium]|nr:zinc-binding dehydrogenase [Rickettsiales bacterium]